MGAIPYGIARSRQAIWLRRLRGRSLCSAVSLTERADLAYGVPSRSALAARLWEATMRSGSCPRRQLLPRETSRSVRRAIATPLPIVLALILLPPIAFASPPDPSWIAGFYDGADGDDVVSLVCETSAGNAAVPLHIGPLPCLPEISLEGIVRSVPGRHFTGGPRAPPVLRSSEFASVFNSFPFPTSGTAALVSFPPITTFRVFWYGDLPALRVCTEHPTPIRSCEPRDHTLSN